MSIEESYGSCNVHLSIAHLLIFYIGSSMYTLSMLQPNFCAKHSQPFIYRSTRKTLDVITPRPVSQMTHLCILYLCINLIPVPNIANPSSTVPLGKHRSREHWTSHFIQGTRKTRLCLTGHPVFMHQPNFCAQTLTTLHL